MMNKSNQIKCISTNGHYNNISIGKIIIKETQTMSKKYTF